MCDNIVHYAVLINMGSACVMRGMPGLIIISSSSRIRWSSFGLSTALRWLWFASRSSRGSIGCDTLVVSRWPGSQHRHRPTSDLVSGSASGNSPLASHSTADRTRPWSGYARPSSSGPTRRYTCCGPRSLGGALRNTPSIWWIAFVWYAQRIVIRAIDIRLSCTMLKSTGMTFGGYSEPLGCRHTWSRSGYASFETGGMGLAPSVGWPVTWPWTVRAAFAPLLWWP